MTAPLHAGGVGLRSNSAIITRPKAEAGNAYLMLAPLPAGDVDLGSDSAIMPKGGMQSGGRLKLKGFEISQNS